MRRTKPASSFDRALLSPRERLIVALDFEREEEALGLVESLGEEVLIYKVGSQLFTRSGPSVVRELRARGKRVFLDLKYHDIPATVAAASLEAARLGVFMLNVHASGGYEMMRACAEACRKVPEPPLALAVTVLTSLGTEDMRGLGLPTNMEEQVLRLARLALEAKMDGLVASPREAPLLRRELGPEPVIATPGVRPLGAGEEELHDQKRVSDPATALAGGADFIVVGGPRPAAPSPR
ncbi:MAG: orotidine-5'-phosphate decarboxylase, partial [Nitrospinota bacterium]